MTRVRLSLSIGALCLCLCQCQCLALAPLLSLGISWRLRIVLYYPAILVPMTKDVHHPYGNACHTTPSLKRG
jgi:hypothetical protein